MSFKVLIIITSPNSLWSLKCQIMENQVSMFFLSSDRETGNLLDEEEFNEVPYSLQFFSEVQIAHSR